MRTSNTVVDVADRHIDGPVLIVTGRYRNSCLVAPKYDRNGHGSISSFKFPYLVLDEETIRNMNINVNKSFKDEPLVARPSFRT